MAADPLVESLESGAVEPSHMPGVFGSIVAEQA